MDELLHSSALLGSAIATLEVLFGASLKLAVFLGVAGVICLAMHRAAAASRHLVWSLALCGGLLLPLLSLGLPDWQVPLFPDVRAAAGLETAQSPVGSLMTSTVPTDVALAGAPLQEATAERNATTSPGATVSSAPQTTLLSEARRLWPVWVLALWMGGAAVVLGQLVLGRWRVRRLAHQAEALKDAGWDELHTSLSRQLGLRQSVELLQAPDASVPMTWGSLHPRVLLPQEARRWPLPRRRVVLLHELAHIQRLDCLTQSLAQVCCALYWFHPLVWVAARALRSEREKACDDLVLSSGAEKASDYAGHLLDIARSMHSSVCCSGFATVAMARRSQLEGRLLAILDPSLSRRALRPGLLAAAVALSAAFLLPLAAIQPMAQAIEPVVPGASVDGAQATVETKAASEADKALKELKEYKEENSKSKDEEQEVVERSASRTAMEVLLSVVEEDPDVEVQREAVDALQHMDGSYKHILRIARTHPNEEVRRQAVDALGDDENQQRALETLLSFVEKDPSVDVRREAINAMRDLPGSFEILAQIARNNSNVEVRREAIEALRHSEDSSRAVSFIVSLIESDPDVEVQTSAVDSLRHLDGSFDHLVRIARSHAKPEVRRAAVHALKDY